MAPALAGCSGGGRSASATAAAFAAAWNRGDTTAMTAMMDHPPPGFGASLAALVSPLRATSAVHTVGSATTRGGAATAPITTTYQLPGVGAWTVASTLDLTHRAGQWQVAWSPAAVAPGLAAGSSLTFVTTWAPRAAVTGAGGTPLTVSEPQVVVGVEGSRVKNAAQLSATLESSGATAAEITSALTAATAHPDYFEPVFTLTAARYAALGGDSSPLYQVPGTVFQHTSARTAATPGLAAHLVGTVGPVTAQELAALGPDYDGTSSVGQTGLEAYYQKQLAGSPGGQVEIVAANGRVTGTLATFPPKAGTAVATSIDPVVQAAAEEAMSGVSGRDGFVAVRVSTGQILAAVSLPASDAFDYALDGEFPPGSTFKVLTTTALLEKGLSPSSPASCPPTVTVDGEVFHNAEGEAPISDIAQAFSESCNTAFVQLATTELTPSDFTAVANEYGIGKAVQMGVPAFSGSVPRPTDGADLAATSIGQAKVVVSPLDMAMVAAAIGRGAVAPARLVTGAPDDTAATVPLPASVVTELRTMMAAVVANGTAAGTGLPAGTYAKTGTAQYGSGNPIPTDAWLIGFRGDVAFAMVVQDSKGNGGPVDGPIIARFLDALPAAYQ
jgi:cell division protein FtsI/penicillin-binding protein 2